MNFFEGFFTAIILASPFWYSLYKFLTTDMGVLSFIVYLAFDVITLIVLTIFFLAVYKYRNREDDIRKIELPG